MTDDAPMSVGIVADDLTGANDAAVQFARRGWQARLTLDDPSAAIPGGYDAGGAAVTAVVTDARAHSAQQARSETSAAIASFAASGVDRVFVKIDSTMRGTVSAQIDGALDVWQAEHADAIAVVCPAYPAMGRTVDAGRVLVEGAGVHTTSVGRDPVTPVTTDGLAALIPGSVALESGPSLATRIEALAADGVRIVTVDATTDADLRGIGDAIVALGARAIPVGSAGLAVVMAEVWGGSSPVVSAPDSARTAGRVVIQVSSLHDVSRGQHAHLAASKHSDRVRTIAPGLAYVSGADAAAAWIERELASSDPLPDVVAVLAPDERGQDADASDQVAAGLAAITDAVIAHAPAAALVLMGGEGARAVLSRLGADAIRVTDAIREGIPIGVVEGGRSHGLTVVTKAGGFGTESSLTEIVPELIGDPAASDSPTASAGTAASAYPDSPPNSAPDPAPPLEPRRTP